jgi:hypothetical protein
MIVDNLIAAAWQQTGLTDFGDDAFREGLGILVQSLNTEAKLTEAGAERWEAILVKTLANRLAVEDHLSKHPELLDPPIDRPMFVFGLPRTGTTLAINLLNADPARRCFLRWEAFTSVPPPAKGALSSDPRCLAEQARLDMSLKYMPHISAMHHEDADSPTECQFAMAPSFCAQYYESSADIPGYRDWFLNTSYLPAFRYHKRLLQLLQAEAGGRWTLKNPWHPLFLDDLTTIYPDAQLVMTHRDPVAVVGSACSLIRAVRHMFSDDVDCLRIGEAMVDIFDRMIARAAAYREKHGEASIYDMHYARLTRDPIGTIRALYRHFDEPFTADAEAAMVAFLAGNPQGKHGKHDYALEDYGLSEAAVRDHFKDYVARFDIPTR